MHRFTIYDPAMCCSTGVCGPSVDPALARFAADAAWLVSKGVEVIRFNLGQEPSAFVANQDVTEMLRKNAEALPIVFLDGEVIAIGAYPSRREMAERAGISMPNGLKNLNLVGQP